MAKMFYTTEEAAARLKLSVDQLKTIVSENKLREFRDGARVMFKVDQVDKLAADPRGASKAGSAAGIQSGPSDSGIGLASSSDSISLADSDVKSPSVTSKEDTVVTSAAPAAPTSIFDTDEIKPADAGAQTQIQPAVEDQLSLEGVGSGSGLLDLTRESDDTSLGAELLDEIYPGGEQKGEGVGSSSGIFESSANESAVAASGPGMEAQMAEAPAAAYPGEAIIEEAPDSTSGAFGGLAIAAFLIMLFAAMVVGSSYMGNSPSWLDALTGEMTKYIMLGAILLVVSILFAAVGFFVGKATSR